MNQVDTDATDARVAEAHMTALYRAHALSLKRLAVLMLDDGAAAEDVVQDAFLGLFRRWGTLTDATGALPYLRASVLNGCRTAMKRRARRSGAVEQGDRPLESAEAAVLHTEEQHMVAAAIRRLPARQREVLVLRYYLDMTEADAAEAMHISKGTVKSATSRAIDAISRALREEQ